MASSVELKRSGSRPLYFHTSDTGTILLWRSLQLELPSGPLSEPEAPASFTTSRPEVLSTSRYSGTKAKCCRPADEGILSSDSYPNRVELSILHNLSLASLNWNKQLSLTPDIDHFVTAPADLLSFFTSRCYD
ncbi:uncharacterized protein P174DRAFT_453386 [Aspergillus novofumigatus IBT 16806]|uniref:Uncharacterized protein n=1 Tax=Aspergillus novofumigatus (strain IBT 16806) TaxID=1392255 RepID=A0A2I1C3E0_ASPN1|nr:uncharacterized protein P174DRAFT_453386 [Aspergillus novofumigatus IBT 16806]PKX92154.1 hypothetical protein P174DRAFT_453386 [Aspergillus novofumigatus IBT 16806]